MPEIIVKSPEDRDTMVQILARNGYTVKQCKTVKPGSKNMTVGTVVYWMDWATSAKEDTHAND